MYQKLRKLAGSRQSYCKNYQAYFFGPPYMYVCMYWFIVLLTISQQHYTDYRLQRYEEYTLKFEHLTANIKTK